MPAILADLYTPILALAFLYRLTRAAPAFRPALFYSAIINLAIAWGGMFADGFFNLWAEWSLDYSTHTAVALALVASLILSAPAQGIFWIISLVGYALLMVSLGYHSIADIVTTALATGALMAPAGLWLYRYGRKSSMR